MKEKKKHVSLYVTIWNFVEAAVFMVLGICFFIFSGNTDFQQVFMTIVGAVLIADGSLRILSDVIPLFFITDKEEFRANNVTPGCFELALGIAVICVDLAFIIEVTALFIGTVLIVSGSLLVIFAIIFLAKKLYSLYMPIVELILGAVLIVLGSLVLVYMRNQTNFLQVMIIVIGLVLVFASIVLFCVAWTALKVYRVAKKVDKAIDKAVEASEAEEKKEPDAEFDMTGEKPAEEEKPAVENQDVKEIEAKDAPEDEEKKG